MNDMTARKRCLVVGGGGREHAIALALARSHAFETVYVAPGITKIGRASCRERV